MVVAIHSCVSTSETYRQIETAELMFGKDSIAIATEIINDIDTAELSSDAERAYYTLIKTILDYCNYEDITSDLAISWCADYYKKHGDKKQYATARHYQSCVQYDLQKHKDAIINEKIAEDVAEQINDIVLLNKVYRQLTIYNYYISNVDETLSYAHNQIATATKTSNSHNQAYANLYLAIIHNELAHFDSVSLYIDKCLSLIKYLDTKDQAYVYSNLGEICLNNDSTVAEKYFLKALEYQKLPETYAHLFKFYQYNNPPKASMYKDSALAKANYENKIAILEELANDEKSKQNYDQVAAYQASIIQIQDSLLHQKKTSEIQKLQKKYDFEKQDNTFHKRVNIFMTIIVVLLLTLIGIYLKWKSKIERVTNEKNNIEKQKMQIEARNAKLAQEKAEADARNAKLLQEKAEIERQNALTEMQNAKLQQEKSEAESKKREDDMRNTYIKSNLFSSLSNSIDSFAALLQDESIPDEMRKIFAERKTAAEKELSAAISICKRIEANIRENKPDPECQREHFYLFVGYYETAHPECKSFFTIYYKNLVPVDKLYLILAHFERKDKDQICTILTWSENTYRSRRSKTKSKQVIDPPQERKCA